MGPTETTPVRRSHIPKRAGPKARLLSIPTVKDRVVPDAYDLTIDGGPGSLGKEWSHFADPPKNATIFDAERIRDLHV